MPARAMQPQVREDEQIIGEGDVHKSALVRGTVAGTGLNAGAGAGVIVGIGATASVQYRTRLTWKTVTDEFPLN